MPAKKGDKLKLEFTGTLDNGDVFDSTEKMGKPLEVTVGEGKLIPGFERALVGMEPGDEKDVKLEPEQAFGHRQDQLVQTIPKNQINIGKEINEGMFLMVGIPGKQQFPAKVLEVTDDDVKLDLNHPLADKTLNFNIKLLEIM